jgi:hypothetical protein
MDNSTYGRVALSAALVAVLLVVTPMACLAQSAQSSAGSSSNSGADESGTEKYWTPKRMREAKPMELHPKTDVPPPPAADATAKSNVPPIGGNGQSGIPLK